MSSTNTKKMCGDDGDRRAVSPVRRARFASRRGTRDCGPAREVYATIAAPAMEQRATQRPQRCVPGRRRGCRGMLSITRWGSDRRHLPTIFRPILGLRIDILPRYDVAGSLNLDRHGADPPPAGVRPRRRRSQCSERARSRAPRPARDRRDPRARGDDRGHGRGLREVGPRDALASASAATTASRSSRGTSTHLRGGQAGGRTQSSGACTLESARATRRSLGLLTRARTASRARSSTSRRYRNVRDLQLMEPHRATNLTLYTGSSLATRAEWTVTRSSVIGSLRPRVGSDIEISTLSTTFDAGTAPTVEFKCRSPGYRYTIEVALSTGETHSETLACLYKRRELRALRAADRDDLLDAMWQTYSLSKAEGQARREGVHDCPSCSTCTTFGRAIASATTCATASASRSATCPSRSEPVYGGAFETRRRGLRELEHDKGASTCPNPMTSRPRRPRVWGQ